MGKTRYKIRKEQLERVVENFVMESANKNVKKTTYSGNHRMSEIKKLMETYNITEDELNEFFETNSKRINKAIEDFKSTYKNDIDAIQKAYNAHTEDYIELSKNFYNKIVGDQMSFIKELAKKHNVKFDEKRPAADSDFMTLRKSLLELVMPMDINTFKKQLDKGGWSASDLGDHTW